MEFKMEPIPAEEMYRFDSLSRLRRESIVRAEEWVVSEDKERFFVDIGKMDHIPYNVRVDEKMPTPLHYWLLGYKGILYGIETERKEVIVRNGYGYAYFEPTIVYIPDEARNGTGELLPNFALLQKEYSRLLDAKNAKDPAFQNLPKFGDIIFQEISYRYIDKEFVSRDL